MGLVLDKKTIVKNIGLFYIIKYSSLELLFVVFVCSTSLSGQDRRQWQRRTITDSSGDPTIPA